MKYDYKTHFKISSIISIVLYLITAFIYFDILWIRDMPNYMPTTRFAIIVCWIFVQIGLSMEIRFTQEQKEEKERKH